MSSVELQRGFITPTADYFINTRQCSDVDASLLLFTLPRSTLSSYHSAVASAVRTCVMRSVSDLVMQMDQSDQATQVITKKQEEAGTSTIYKISSFAKPPQSSVWLYEHKIQPIKELISLNPTSEGADLTKPTKLDS